MFLDLEATKHGLSEYFVPFSRSEAAHLWGVQNRMEQRNLENVQNIIHFQVFVSHSSYGVVGASEV